MKHPLKEAYVVYSTSEWSVTETGEVQVSWSHFLDGKLEVELGTRIAFGHQNKESRCKSQTCSLQFCVCAYV